jgi:nucleotide-binding universal stress UspA family protein
VSVEALRYAHQVALRELIVLHVLKPQENYENCREKLRFLAAFNRSNTVPVEYFVVSGDPGERIAEYAQKFGVSLVVLGSPKSELSEQDLQDSTVLEVITKTRCPVLCLPLANDSSTLGVVRHTATA